MCYGTSAHFGLFGLLMPLYSTCTVIQGSNTKFDYPLFMMLCQCIVATISSLFGMNISHLCQCLCGVCSFSTRHGDLHCHIHAACLRACLLAQC
jgi:hypothetical protein